MAPGQNHSHTTDLYPPINFHFTAHQFKFLDVAEMSCTKIAATSLSPPSLPFSDNGLPSCQTPLIDDPFTIPLLVMASCSVNKASSPGQGGLTHTALAHLEEAGKRFLLDPIQPVLQSRFSSAQLEGCSYCDHTETSKISYRHSVVLTYCSFLLRRQTDRNNCAASIRLGSKY